MEKRTRFIGAAELSVHLSSMNPLGYIDERVAHKKFERALIRACLEVIEQSSVKESLRGDGIVALGAVQKFFHFSEIDDAIFFCRRLRAMLLEERLPFKICVGIGEICHGGIIEEWGPILSEYEKENSDVLSTKLIDFFSTSNPDRIRDVFDLYRSPSFRTDIIQLGLDLQNFKGLGVHLSSEVFEAAAEKDRAKIFRNYFPSQNSARKYTATEFQDIKFSFSEEDIVYRYKDHAKASESIAGFGAESNNQIEGLFDQIKHCYSARKDSTVFFASSLITLIRSSSFKRLAMLEKQVTDPSSGVLLSQGWQFFPPIFGALFSGSYKAKEHLKNLAL